MKECLLFKHRDFIFRLSEFRNNKAKLLKLIKNSKSTEIKAIGELSFNILNGSVLCSTYRKNRLKPYVNCLRFLADKKISLKRKKSKILSGNGILLGALIPLAINAITNLAGNYIKKK